MDADWDAAHEFWEEDEAQHLMICHQYETEIALCRQAGNLVLIPPQGFEATCVASWGQPSACFERPCSGPTEPGCCMGLALSYQLQIFVCFNAGISSKTFSVWDSCYLSLFEFLFYWSHSQIVAAAVCFTSWIPC